MVLSRTKLNRKFEVKSEQLELRKKSRFGLDLISFHLTIQSFEMQATLKNREHRTIYFKGLVKLFKFRATRMTHRLRIFLFHANSVVSFQIYAQLSVKSAQNMNFT